MTEKRFKEIVSVETIVDNKTGLHYKPVMLSDDFLDLINKIAKENEHLKNKLEFFYELNKPYGDIIKELGKFKEWEKYSRDVKREELDRVFKMSIYEIAETFKYYEERIKKLERELEELDVYKPYSIKRAKKPYL